MCSVALGLPQTWAASHISKDTDAKDMVPHERHNNMMTKVKWSTETNDIDNRFLREYDNVCKLMEDRQITDYYAAQRHIQSAMMGDTPVKTVQNRQYIDNLSDYDSERYRISKSVCHKLDLGANSLPGAQQHTTVETAAAIEMQDNKKGDFKAHDYLDLASTNIIQYRTRGQKQRQKANEMIDANRCSTHLEYIKPNTRVKTKGKRYQMMKILI